MSFICRLKYFLFYQTAYAGEKGCVNTCGMFPDIFLREDTTQAAPTCTNNMCNCTGNGKSMYTLGFRSSVCISYCLSKYLV